MIKVLVSDGMAPEGLEIFKKYPQIKVDVHSKLPADELKKIIADYDGLSVRSATKVTAEIIGLAKKLKVVGRAGIGVDNVDIPTASSKGIVVMNTPGGNTITTAEHAISLMMSMSRKIPQATASMKAGKWEKSKFSGVELFNKTVGVVGLGNIGSVVADRAIGLKMKVIGYDPYISKEKASQIGVELVSLDELFKRADFITLHIPVNAETKNLINVKTIEKMKKGVYIINCARGGIVNEKDLYDALVSGKVKAAALDVYEKEPPVENPLLTLENIVCTPHLGASTGEAQVNVSVAIAEQIAEYLVNGIISNALNVPSVKAEVLTAIKPYLVLGEKLGSFKAQILEEAPEEINIEYSGDVVQYGTGPVTISILKGFLAPIVGENVNFVNAPIIAKERGIKVSETRTSQTQDFASLITLKVKSKGHTGIVAGAIFGKSDPRIVRINDFLLEATPEGYMLFMYNYDKPGFIGNIGTLLGKHNINIAGLQLGRESIGGKAVSLVLIDNPLTAEALKEVKKIPNMISAKMIKL